MVATESAVAKESSEEELSDSECSATSLTHTANDAHFHMIDSLLQWFVQNVFDGK